MAFLERIFKIRLNALARANQPGGVEQHQHDIGLARDPASGQRNNHRALETPGGQFFVGMVIHVFPNLHCYHVQLSGQGGMRVCTTLTHTSLTPMSTAEACTLTPLTRVLVFMPQWSTTGYIIGVIPGYALETGTQFSDFFVGMSNAGIGYEKMYTAAAETRTGVPSFTAGRPGDVLPGDLAYMNELGLGLLIGRTMLSLRVGDLAKLEMFYLDHLVRLCTVNFEHFATGYERHLKEDEGEISDIEMLTPYPWEGLGLRSPATAFKTGNSEAWLPGQEDADHEPKEPDQEGIFRLRRYRGYLGDLERVVVSAPTYSGGSEVRTSQSQEDVGLFEQILGVDGTYSLRSAKQILLMKDCLIPVPQRKKREEDPEGDSPHNDSKYKAAGQFGEGETHTRHDFSFSADDPAGRGAQLDDLYAYLTQEQQPTTFVKHSKDWEFPQPSQIKVGGTAMYHDSPAMTGRFQAPLPSSTNVKVDHRTDVEIFKSRSTFAMLDDGSIVIGDAYGSQIKLAGGNIYITCPGDVFLQPGRSLISWAGRDVVLRSHQHVDVTAAQGDVRLKSERNMQLLAGNSGTGGILIESRADGQTNDFSQAGSDVVSSGVLLKSENGPLLAYTKNAYLRTGTGGNFVVDADAGNGSVTLNGNQIVQNAKNAALIAVGGDLKAGRQPEAVHYFGQNQSAIGNNLIVDGSITALDRIVADGAIVANGPMAGTSSPFIGAVPEDFAERLAEVSGPLRETLQGRFSSQLAELGQALYAEPDDWGHDSFAEQLMATLRTDQQYGLDGSAEFLIYEAPWQRRATGQWKEPPVSGPDGDTYPHPGKSNWLERNTFGLTDPEFYDDTSGLPDDRPYGSPTAGSVHKVTPASRYRIQE